MTRMTWGRGLSSIGIAVCATVFGIPGTGAIAGAAEQGASATCTSQKVDAYTGRASCINLGNFTKYRVIVPCITASGARFEAMGTWTKKGWSTAKCSSNGVAGIDGTNYIDYEIE
ncbi:hypothetical protein [Streptomyces sp. NPDC096068]|uniref:hypothetical protein n=1 Tax=Streptomyces sp. NPDC096068 TaxID=3155424 RepID=UPI00332C9E29